MDHAPRKFGKFTEETIRAAVTRDRESAAAATPYWHHSHGCVIDREGTIITWLEGQKNLYHGNAGRDPMKDLANARFMVGARGSVERRCDMIEALLDYIAKLEAAVPAPTNAFHAECPACGEKVDVIPAAAE